jgi:hypothetical protein
MTSRYLKSPRQCAVALFVALCCWLPLGAQEAPAPSEYQVKAVFLLNFLKYVEWPAAAHSTTNSPFKIVQAGEDRFAPDFGAFVKSKAIDGRAVTLKRSGAADDWQRCHILFVSGSEKRNVRNILSAVKGRPVLTVGESDNFIAEGGMINFVMKDNKVRLHINLVAVEKAGLKISSRLLGVADVVKRE